MRLVIITILTGFALMGCGKNEPISTAVSQSPTTTTPSTTLTANTKTVVGEVWFGAGAFGVGNDNNTNIVLPPNSPMVKQILANCSEGDICEVVGIIDNKELVSVTSTKLVKKEGAQPSPYSQAAPQPSTTVPQSQSSSSSQLLLNRDGKSIYGNAGYCLGIVGFAADEFGIPIASHSQNTKAVIEKYGQINKAITSRVVSCTNGVDTSEARNTCLNRETNINEVELFKQYVSGLSSPNLGNTTELRRMNIDLICKLAVYDMQGL